MFENTTVRALMDAVVDDVVGAAEAGVRDDLLASIEEMSDEDAEEMLRRLRAC